MERVFVTGGTGFVGGALIRLLVREGHAVRGLMRPGDPAQRLRTPGVERLAADLWDRDALARGMAGCECVFHVAALYAYWGHPWADYQRSNIDGTRAVLEAARTAGIRRVVYTSSIATLGIPRGGEPGTEETPVGLEDMRGYYKRSKYLAEEVAREMYALGLPVVIVNPGAPVGVGDHKPTPTGRIIVDYLNGRMPAYVDTGLTLVDVDDVAAGHILAARRGRPGERYILGGECLTLRRVLDLLAEISGGPRVRIRIPHSVAMAWAHVDTALARLDPRRVPSATPEAVRVSRTPEYFSSAKAVKELGYTPGPVSAALGKAVSWYRANGYAPGGASAVP